MPITYADPGIQEDLEEFSIALESIDMQEVKEETLLRVAREMSEMVRQAVVAEDDIISPAMNGPHERGDGPSMATKDAWVVNQSGPNQISVSPHPKVRQRAIVLNEGYPGRIYPTSSEALHFTIGAVPVFAKSVKGPERTGYWNAAFRRMESSGKFEEIGELVLRNEFEEAGLL